jgi:hypothetical protein
MGARVLINGTWYKSSSDHSPLGRLLDARFRMSMGQLSSESAATETPRGERSHAVGAHVAEVMG